MTPSHPKLIKSFLSTCSGQELKSTFREKKMKQSQISCLRCPAYSRDDLYFATNRPFPIVRRTLPGVNNIYRQSFVLPIQFELTLMELFQVLQQRST